MTEILFILLALLSAWEEINELIRDGSWSRDTFYKFLCWETDWQSKWKNFDSKHVSFGLFALVLCIFLTTCTNLVYNWFDEWIINLFLSIIINWLVFFYIRNLGMHILFRKKDRQWKYLLPIQKVGS